MTTLTAVKDDPDLPVGREARRLREARHLTQKELADRAGLHPNYIGRIERGESNAGVKRCSSWRGGWGSNLRRCLGDSLFSSEIRSER
ncbi:MAG TPA: helix-turn-helix transcriptional regulator, partial [Allosphingosinicella sp.]